MRLSSVLFLAMVLFVSLAPAQDKESELKATAPLSGRPVVPEVTLEATGVPRATTQRLDAVLAPVVCDRNENLYFRIVGADPGASPLVRIGASGGSPAVFDASKLPGVNREVDMLAFTVDEHGKVYEVIRLVEGKQKISNYIVSFSKDGEVLTKTKLLPDFMPYAFTALESGEYFFSGIGVKKSKDDIPSAISGIFDSSGKMKHNLKLEGDDFNPALEQKGPEEKSSGKDGQGARAPDLRHAAIQNGTSIYGADKNIYVFRASHPVELRVINPAGEVVKRHRLKAPFEKAEPFEFRIGGNLILVGFKPAESKGGTEVAPVYTIFDLERAEPILNYRFGESIRGALGCFTGDRFTFLTGTRDGHFAILEAKAK